MLVGPPGSGKSTLAKQLIDQGYVYVNQDTQKADHITICDLAVLAGDNVVVDRMNFNKMQRDRYLWLAKKHGYETTITVLHQPREVCYQRIIKRFDTHPTITDDSKAKSALNTFFSKYERPTPDEADIINFVYPPGAKDEAVICDLDGTLCNVDHRLHHVRKPEGEKKNWKAFFDELVNDTPNQWCATIIHSFVDLSRLEVVFASGRPDDHERNTKNWLDSYGFPTNNLYMRCRGDHRQDYIAKEIILDFEILTRFKPLFFIDDRKQVVDLWRNRGFIALQCHEGDF